MVKAVTPLTPTEMSEGRYRDLRMGFELHAPQAQWRFSERKIERFGPRVVIGIGAQLPSTVKSPISRNVTVPPYKSRPPTKNAKNPQCEALTARCASLVGVTI